MWFLPFGLPSIVNVNGHLIGECGWPGDLVLLPTFRPLATMDFLLLPVEKVTQIADQHKLASGR
jgi:hypothetical protein